MNENGNPRVPIQEVDDNLCTPNFTSNLGVIPTSYKDSMDFYETLNWLVKYLEDTIIPAVNEDIEAVEELERLFDELKAYVDTFAEAIASKQPMITQDNPLASDLVSTANQVNKFVTQAQLILINSIPNKEDVANRVEEITEYSTNTEYPTAKAVYDLSLLKEDIANKVNAITSASTDTEYPSAKAVYDVSENLNSMINDIYNVLPRVSGTGSTVTLNDSAETRLDITPIGNCEQDTFSGKNLIGLVDGTYTANEGEVTAVVSNGVITLNGTTTQINFIQIVANTNYSSIAVGDKFTISANNIEAGNVTVRTNINSAYDIICNSINKIQTFTLIENRPLQLNLTIRVSSDITLTNFVLQPQLEKGSTATSWEKYVGGIPSPNPDYPQDIRVVTGDNDVVVSNKNLIVKTDLIDGYRLDSSGQPYASETQTLTPYITVTPNTQYHRNSTFNTSNPVCLYDKNKTFISRITTGTTFTTTSETYYIRTAFFVIDKDTEQLELGNTETTYVQGKSQKVTLHLGTNYLAGIGDYGDEIVGKTDDWKIVRKVGKVTLVGTEEYDVSQSGSLYRFAYYPSDLLYINALDNNVRSNYFHAITTAEKGAISLFRNRFFMYPTDDTITDVPAFKNWLTNHNTLVYYPLATPTQTPITDTLLIQSLNELYELMGYDGQTNISIIPSTGNAQGELYVSTLKKIS